MNIFQVIRLGTVNYAQGLQQQLRASQLVKNSLDGNNTRHILLLLEHFPVYTVGIRSAIYSEQEEQRLKLLGADFHRTGRGGLVTFHGPGQLVAYPICALGKLSVEGGERGASRVGVKRFVELLEETIIDTAKRCGVVDAARRSDAPGVYVKGRKVASVGVSFSGGISSHGIALNCTTDLAWFSHVIPCGLEGIEMTSLSKERDQSLPVDEVTPIFIESFGTAFQASIEYLKD